MTVGNKISAYVYAGNQVIAQQWGGSMLWQHNNPVMGDAVSVQSNSVAMERTTADPTGVNTGDEDPFAEPWDGEMPGGGSQLLGGSIMAHFFPGMGGPKCYERGSLVGCAMIFGLVSMGAAVEGSTREQIRNRIPGNNNAPPPPGYVPPLDPEPLDPNIPEDEGPAVQVQNWGTYDTWETLYYGVRVKSCGNGFTHPRFSRFSEPVFKWGYSVVRPPLVFPDGLVAARFFPIAGAA